MNIRAITPDFQNVNNSRKKFLNNSIVIQPNSLNYLAKDTVSFSGKAQITNTIGDIIRKNYDDKIPQYRAMSIKLMDTMEVIANKFKDKGVSFDRKYCEHSPVKSTDSFISKFRRSGENPYDRIRTTLYVENPYDFKLIRDILGELKLRGYEIAQIPDKVSGKRVLSRKPDFDIRLANVNEADTKILGAELQNQISKPLSTGYEDIQMRLTDTALKGKDTPPLEVLILYGKNFAKAKETESYYSYDIRRAIDKLLHISSVKNPPINSPAYRVHSNNRIICDTLCNNISKPLFYNAKNKDFNHESFQLPVELSKSTIKALTGLIEGIRSKISLHYKAEIAKISSDEFKPELEKLFKASQEYKERQDKTIYIKDLIDMKNQLINNLKAQKKDDLTLIMKVQERFAETAEKFGKKD